MERLRIDKWLWAARFYKTRSLASDEIDRGRVQVNGVVVKASRELKAGDTVRLRNGEIQRTLLVQAISDRRGGAPEAALLYTETAESVQARLALAEQRRLADRLRSFGDCGDAVDIWTAEGIAHAEAVPELPADQFIALANRIGRTSRDAR